MNISDIVQTYANIVAWGLPICVVFKMGSLIVNTVISAFFGGELVFDK